MDLTRPPVPSPGLRTRAHIVARVGTRATACGLLLLVSVSSCGDARTAPTAPETPTPVLLNPVNVPPTAVFAISPRWPQPGDTVTFDARYSIDSDGVVMAYEWNLGNGTAQVTGAQARTVFRTAGTYAISLVARDDSGATATASMSLVVSNAGAPAGSVSASMSTLTLSAGSIAAGTTPATATVTVRDAGGVPLSGVPVRLGSEGRALSLTQPSGTSSGTGVATGTVSSRMAQSTSIRAIADYVLLTAAPTLAVTPATVSATTSAVRRTDSLVTRLGDSTLIEVTARDADGNPVAGAAVSVSLSGGTATVRNEGATDANGRRVISVLPTVCGAVLTAQVTVGGVALTTQPRIAATGPGAYSVCSVSLRLDATVASSFTLESGNRITQWRDLSGYGRHVSIGSGSGQRPTYQSTNSIRGRAGVLFDPALSQYLTSSAAVDARTVFVVHRPTSEGAADRTTFSIRSSQTNSSFPAAEAFYLKSNDGAGTNSVWAVYTSNDWTYAQGARNPDIPNLLTAEILASTVRVASNRGTRGTDTWTGTLLARDGVATVGAAWWNNTLVDFYLGRIGEVVAFDRMLSDAERDIVELALMAKWGLGNFSTDAGNAQTAVAGTSPAIAPRVRVVDATGIGIPNAPVTWQVTAGGGRVNGSTQYATTTDANGYASVPVGLWVLDAGSNTLTAWLSGTAGGGSSEVFTATGTLPSGLQLRVDGSDSASMRATSTCTGTVASNGTVGCWLDRSGNAANAVQATSTSRPTRVVNGINGRDAMQFTLASESWFAVTAAAVRALRSQSRTVIAAVRAGVSEGGSTNEAQAIAIWPGWHSGLMIYHVGTWRAVWAEHFSTLAGGTYSGTGLGDVPVNGTVVGTEVLQYTAAASWTQTAWLNGVASTSDSQTAASSSGVVDLRIGQANVAPDTDYRWRFNGRIGELLVFNRALTNAERLQVERYLGWKWGVAVQ